LLLSTKPALEPLPAIVFQRLLRTLEKCYPVTPSGLLSGLFNFMLSHFSFSFILFCLIKKGCKKIKAYNKSGIFNGIYAAQANSPFGFGQRLLAQMSISINTIKNADPDFL